MSSDDLVARLLDLLERLSGLAAAGRARWPEYAARLDQARALARRRLLTGDAEPAEELAAALVSFGHEDDGTGEWQYTVDLAALLVAILSDVPPAEVLEDALLAHLDTSEAVIVNRRAVELGRPVSETEAQAWLAGSPEWQATTAFVTGLGIR